MCGRLRQSYINIVNTVNYEWHIIPRCQSVTPPVAGKQPTTAAAAWFILNKSKHFHALEVVDYIWFFVLN